MGAAALEDKILDIPSLHVPEGVCATPSPSELAQQAQIKDLGSLRASGGFDKGLFPWVGSLRNVLGYPRELPFPGVAKPSGYPAINDFCFSDFCFIISGFSSPFPSPLKNKNKKTHCYVSNDIQLIETTIPLAKATRNLKPRLAAC